jgi:hypothetical protein
MSGSPTAGDVQTFPVGEQELSFSLSVMENYKPNISPTGAGSRRRTGKIMAGVWIAGTGASIALGWPWWARGLLAIPAALAAVNLLQARRMTCVLRAGEGTFEGDDFTTTPAPPADAEASRQVATGIWRDTILIGAAGALLPIATSALR